MRRCFTLIVTTTLLLGSVATASAQSRVKAARQHADRGLTEYNLGQFTEAIAHFERAYKIDPAPVFLFNIAQAHRQTGNHERALFFYRRYLEQAPQAANRADVEKRMSDLKDAIARQEELKRKPPTELEAPPREASAAPATGPIEPAIETAVEPAIETADGAAEPPRFRVLAQAGVGLPRFSGSTLDQPTLLAVDVGALYAFRMAATELDAGVAVSWSPLAYRTVTAGSSSQSHLVGALATAAIRRRLGERFALRAHVGGGVTWWGGIGEDNPFTVGGDKPSGAIPMPSGRLGGAFEVRVTEAAWLQLGATGTFMKTTSPGLTRRVSSLTRIDLAAGVAYWF